MVCVSIWESSTGLEHFESSRRRLVLSAKADSLSPLKSPALTPLGQRLRATSRLNGEEALPNNAAHVIEEPCTPSLRPALSGGRLPTSGAAGSCLAVPVESCSLPTRARAKYRVERGRLCLSDHRGRRGERHVYILEDIACGDAKTTLGGLDEIVSSFARVFASESIDEHHRFRKLTSAHQETSAVDSPFLFTIHFVVPLGGGLLRATTRELRIYFLNCWYNNAYQFYSR